MAGKTPGYGPLNHGKIFAYENIDAQKSNQRDEMDEGVVYPGILQAIWLLILLVFLLIVLGAIIDIVGFSQEESIIISISNTISFTLILLWGSKKARASFKEIFPVGSFPMFFLIPMGLVIFGFSIVASELDNVFRAVLLPPDWLSDIYLLLAGHDTTPLGSILALVVVAPMTEEFLFRGLILRGLLSHYGVRKAIFASAILFGLFHLNPWQLVQTTAIGILFAWWFIKTGSLVPCIFGHALNNGLLFIYRDIFGLDIMGYTTGMGRENQFQPIWLDLIGALLMVLGIWLLIDMFQQAGKSSPMGPPRENRNTSIQPTSV